MHRSFFTCLMFTLAASFCEGKQAAASPPRGWRSWIAYRQEADQQHMEAAMDAIHKPRPLNGKMVSLQDLGYSDVGLDGGWARCDGVNGSYHDHKGQPLINTTKFPSFSAMNEKAHSLGLTSSWYLNCDQCGTEETLTQSAFTDTWYTNDAMKAAELKFDGVKFDTQPGGPNWDIREWAIAINATGREMVLEDCLDKHPDGEPLKKSDHASLDLLHHPTTCPYNVNFYRTGGDNFPTFYIGMAHVIVDMLPFLEKTTPVPASRPGCWAYPDMLSIGPSNMQEMWVEEGCPRMTLEEEKTLFANWAIVSSPLILSFDITNETAVETLWPIITNELALSINEQWAGEAGRLLKRSTATINASDCRTGIDKVTTLPSWAIWSKKLSNPPNSIAVLAINIGESPQSINISYEELVGAGVGFGTASKKMVATDVWTGEVAGHVSSGGSWHEEIRSAHQSRFLIFSPAGDGLAN